MSAQILAENPDFLAPPPTKTVEDELVASVFSLLGKAPPTRGRMERRQQQRYPYPHPIELTPVSADGSLLEAESLSVMGKHLSAGGLDFFHHEPVPYRRVIATLTQEDGQQVRLLVDLTWCRFVGHGWYDNGGRFLSLEPDKEGTKP